MKKDIRNIFIVLLLFSMASGIFYNFQELWMVENGLSIKTIGTVFSICAILTVSTIFLCSNLIKRKKIKPFIISVLFIRLITIILLFFLHKTGLNILIKFLIMMEYVASTEVLVSIYPLITLVCKNDKTYAKKDICYNAGYYLGILLTGFLLGKRVLSFEISYNFYLIISCILITIAIIMLLKIDTTKYHEKIGHEDNHLLSDLVKSIKKDTISKTYLSTIFLNSIAWCTVFGLITTVIVTYFDFSPFISSNVLIITGLVSVLLGLLVLSKLTFKNNYINISIKYAIRVFLYFSAALFNYKSLFIIAFFYPRVTTDSYGHIADAPFTNRIDNKYQLAFCNLKEMISYFGKALGTYICGMTLAINIRFMFLFAAVISLLELILRYRLVYLKSKEDSNDR